MEFGTAGVPRTPKGKSWNERRRADTYRCAAIMKSRHSSKSRYRINFWHRTWTLLDSSSTDSLTRAWTVLVLVGQKFWTMDGLGDLTWRPSIVSRNLCETNVCQASYKSQTQLQILVAPALYKHELTPCSTNRFYLYNDRTNPSISSNRS